MATLDLNTSPYYDDFDEDKKFARILFKPGVAVQARELTQLQTILSDQLDKFSSFNYVDGTIISGCNQNKAQIPYIKIDDNDAGSPSNAVTNLSSYVGDVVIGSSTGIRAEIIDTRDGIASSAPLTKTLYLKYIDMGGTTNVNNLNHFDSNETLTVETTRPDGTTSPNATNTFVTLATVGSASQPEDYWYGTATKIQLDEGVVFAKGSFVKTDVISTYASLHGELDKRYVGFVITESIVTSASDNSLLDPASGTYNYNAPGADRLKIEITLASYAAGTATPSNFVRYLRVEDNAVDSVNINGGDPLGPVGKVMASYRDDANGDYIVSGCLSSWHEHLRNDEGTNGGKFTAADGGDASKLVMRISPGKLVLNGRSYERRLKTELTIDKPQEYVDVENYSLSTEFGNYVIVNELAGQWNLNEGGVIKLFDAAQTAATSGDYSARVLQGNQIGTARARSLRFHSGNPAEAATQYKLYLYDVNISGQDKSFEDVKSIVHQLSVVTSQSLDGYADVVLETVANRSNPVAVLKDPSYRALVYPLPQLGVKGHVVNDNVFWYLKRMSATIGANPHTLIFIADATGNEQFITDTSATNRVQNMVMTSTSSSTVYMQDASGNAVTISPGEPIPLDDTFISNYSTSTGGQLTFTFRGVFSDVAMTQTTTCDVELHVPVKKTSTNPLTKTLSEDNFVFIDLTTHPNGLQGPYHLGFSDGYKIKGVWGYSSQEWTALVANNYDPTGIQGVNITQSFYFNNGQKDGYYDHCSIEKTGSTNLAPYEKLIVQLDYFEHSATNPGGSYFTIDSYPVGTGDFQLQDVPLYFTERVGTFPLRNCVDFRPRLSDTADNTISGTISGSWNSGNGNVNPSNTANLEDAGQGIHIPIPTEQFTTDYSYYLRKAWKLVFDDTSKTFVILQSKAGLRPQIPKTPPNTLEISRGRFAYYPTLAPAEAQLSKRMDLATTLTKSDQRGFTFKDIRALDVRVKALEKYVSLNLLEQKSEAVKIANSTGADRFKNGIFIDDFDDLLRSATADVDFRAAVQKEKSILRPFFVADKFKPKIASLGNLQTGQGEFTDIVTKSYTEITYLEQHAASKVRNLLGMLQFHYGGVLTLTPRSNNNSITTSSSSVSANFGEATANAVAQMANALGTQWNDWQDVGDPRTEDSDFSEWSDWEITGRTGFISWDESIRLQDPRVQEWLDDPTLQTDPDNIPGVGGGVLQETRERDFIRRIIQDRARDGTIFSGSTTSGESLNFSAIDDVQFGSNQGSANIRVDVTRMKPNTQLYVYYDGQGVSSNVPGSIGSYIKRSASSSLNHSLMTDADGELTCWFRIPAGVFPTGMTELKFTDDSLNRDIFASTTASVIIPSTTLNLSEVNVNITETVANVTTQPTTQEEEVVLSESQETEVETRVRFYDPIAQGFTIATPKIPEGTSQENATPHKYRHGAYVTGFDFWFKDRTSQTDANGNYDGVIVQLRNMVNGYPGPVVIAEKRIPRSDVVPTPPSGSTYIFSGNETTVTFDKPVYLIPNTEYCVVLMPENNNPDYNAWVAELGQDNLTEISTETNRGDRITKVESSGTFFVSSNNTTWNAIQKEDLMMNINVAEFATADETATFHARELDFVNFRNGDSEVVTAEDVDGINIEITNVGSGYSTAPTLTFSAPTTTGGVTATAVATINSSGAVDSIRVTEPGVGYTAAPTLTITGTNTTPLTANAYLLKSTVDRVDIQNRNHVLDRSGQTHATGVNSNRTAFTVAPKSTILAATITSGETDATRPSGTYSNVSPTGGTTAGTPDIEATMTIVVGTGGLNTGQASITLSNLGLGYAVGDTLEFDSTVLGGSTPLVVTITRLQNSAITSLQDDGNGNDVVVGRTSGYVRTFNTGIWIDQIRDRTVTASQVTYNHTIQKGATSLDLQLAWTPYNANYQSSTNNAVGTTYIDQEQGDTTEYKAQYNVASRSNELMYFQGNRTFTGKIIFKHDDTYYSRVSPRVDFELFEAVIVQNMLNNDATGEDSTDGGNADSRWLSQVVALAEGMDAEDLKVYLTMSKWTSNTVKVYAKLKSDDDDLGTLQRDIRWTELVIDEAPLQQDTGFAEYVYTLPNYGIRATEMVAGTEYKIISADPSAGNDPAYSFVTAGAANNNVDTVFTATQSIQGVGTVVETGIYARGIDITDAGDYEGVFKYDIGRVYSIPVAAAGSGYLNAPTVTISGGGGRQARAVAVLNGSGGVDRIDVIDGGRDFTSAPTVTLSGGGGVGATAGTATLATVQFKSFKQFQIKVVLLGENTYDYPVIQDLRAIALQV